MFIRIKITKSTIRQFAPANAKFPKQQIKLKYFLILLIS